MQLSKNSIGLDPRRLILIVFGSCSALLALAGCAQVTESVGFCCPVVVIYLLVGFLLAIHPATRGVAVGAISVGVLGGIFCCMIVSSGPVNEFTIMGAVWLQVGLLIVGLPILGLWTLGCIFAAYRRKQGFHNSSQSDSANGSVDDSQME